jgi:hypothetical protein
MQLVVLGFLCGWTHVKVARDRLVVGGGLTVPAGTTWLESASTTAPFVDKTTPGRVGVDRMLNPVSF